MMDVVVGARLLKIAIVVSNARRRAVVVGVVQRLRPCIEGVQRQPLRMALLKPERPGVVGVMSEVRDQIHIAELRIRLEILKLLPDRFSPRRIAHREVTNRLDVGVPRVHQFDARRPLIKRFHQPGIGELILDTAGPIHHVGRTHVRVVPSGVALREVSSNIGYAAVLVDAEVDCRRSLRKFEDRARIARGRLDVGAC